MAITMQEEYVDDWWEEVAARAWKRLLATPYETLGPAARMLIDHHRAELRAVSEPWCVWEWEAK